MQLRLPFWTEKYKRVISSEAQIFKGQLPRKWEGPLPLPYSGSASWPAEHTTTILQTQAGPVWPSPCCLKLGSLCSSWDTAGAPGQHTKHHLLQWPHQYQGWAFSVHAKNHPFLSTEMQIFESIIQVCKASEIVCLKILLKLIFLSFKKLVKTALLVLRTSIKTQQRQLPFSLLVIGQVIKAPVHTSCAQQGRGIQVGQNLQQDFWRQAERVGGQRGGCGTWNTIGCSPPQRRR